MIGTPYKLNEQTIHMHFYHASQLTGKYQQSLQSFTAIGTGLVQSITVSVQHYQYGPVPHDVTCWP